MATRVQGELKNEVEYKGDTIRETMGKLKIACITKGTT